MNLDKKAKRILYFISGGHGMQPIMRFIRNNDKDIHEIVIGSADNGGHTGLLLSMFDKNGKMVYLPIGDLRNLVSLFLLTQNDEKSIEIANLLKHRTNNLQEIENLARDLLILMAFEEGSIEWDAVMNFIPEYIEVFNSSSEWVYNQHNIGNIVFFGLMKEFGSEVLIDIVKKYNLIPEHVNLHFFSEEPLTLYAQDVEDTRNDGTRFTRILVGESTIDEYNASEIHPSKLGYQKNDGSEFSVDDLNPKIKNLIKNAGIVVVPNGSIENIFPAFGFAIKAGLLEDKLIIRLVNFATFPRNVDFTTEFVYLLKLGLKPNQLLYLRPDRCLQLNEMGIEIREGISADMRSKYIQQRKIIEINRISIQEIVERLVKRGFSPEEAIDFANEIYSSTLSVLKLHEFPNGVKQGLNGDAVLETGIRHDDFILEIAMGFVLERDDLFDMTIETRDRVEEELRNAWYNNDELQVK